MNAQEICYMSTKIRENIEKVIIGKSYHINVILAAFFAQGHVLIEDVPGTGKTMLAKTLAKSFNCDFGRIQFTPDLLPSDLIGLEVYNPQNGSFTLKKGAVFTNILLADEINRAMPRTQSALLESMEERQITIDVETHELNPPFFVIATQNPIETQGTFALPEAQLDRFMIKLSLEYPSKSDTLKILKNFSQSSPLNELEPVCDKETAIEIFKSVKNIYTDDEILSYAIDLAEKTRSHPSVLLGVSTRGLMALINISKAYAAIQGRQYVIPDDVQTLLPYVCAHRLICGSGARRKEYDVLKEILNSTAVPVENWEGI